MREYLAKIGKYAQNHGAEFVVGPWSSMYWIKCGIIFVDDRNPILTQVVHASHELGHHLDMKHSNTVDNLMNAHRVAKLVRLPGIYNREVFVSEKTAWSYAEQVLCSMGYFRQENRYCKFSKMRYSALNTYEAQVLNLPIKEKCRRTDAVAFISRNP